MRPKPSTLFTSPRSASDFVVRLVFFALAPVAIVAAAAFFPVTGALVSVVIALAVFLLGEAIRSHASARPWVGKLLRRPLALEAYYRMRPPRPFLYYVFYPLLFPYWIYNREARTEFVLFKGFTLGSIFVLALSVTYQYFVNWRPELSILDYLPVLGLTLAVEWLLVLALLMPIVTTVVGFHSTMRRGRLVALLVVATVSTGIAIARIVRRRDAVVTFATRERVLLRTSADRKRARLAELAGLQAAWSNFRTVPGKIEGDGKVEGDPLDAAHGQLERFYKHDEASAFDLWASPRKNPEILVLYFEARRSHDPIWVALRKNGAEITDAKLLPKGAFAAMRHATDK